MDYGHDLFFGAFLTPAAATPDRVVALARLAEDVGLDLLGLQDHPYQPAHLDAWTLLSYVGAATDRIRLALDVANLPLRPAAVLARSVATLDRLTGGRVELGLGAGGFLDAVRAVGGPDLDRRTSVDALEEGIAVVRAMWGDQRRGVRAGGEHHAVRGVHPGPPPAHDVGVWLGAYGPRMLRLTGRVADGWLPSSPYAAPERLVELNRTIDEAAVEAGRDPAAVRRIYNVVGDFGGRGTDFLSGPPAVWAEQLADLALGDGISGFVLMGDEPDVLRRWAAEVTPAVAELVAVERAGASAPEPAPEPVADSPVATPVVVSAVPGLDVVPTPDDGVRLAAAPVWDESVRPTGPPPAAGRRYGRAEQAAGQHLVDIHDHLRGELRQLRELVDRVLAGTTTPGAARSHINTMTMRQNAWTAGTYCVQYCRVVTGHHSLEDAAVFPHLRRADPRLAPVIDRLEQEHRVIHDVLEEVDAALVAFVGDDPAGTALQLALDRLHDALLSHLSYEERELVEPLARLGFG